MVNLDRQSLSSTASTFPIPSSLSDLERSPYNLLPYPYDFDDEDEAARADSFERLVNELEQGNRGLSTGGISLFENIDEEEQWMDEDRVQAMYTLVRKSTSLAPSTRTRLVHTLCEALKTLSSILESKNYAPHNQNAQTEAAVSQVVPQTFRDAFACHLYMMFSIMFFVESEAKVAKGIKGDKGGDSNFTASSRAACADAMMVAAKAMSKNRAILWRRGVPDEAVVIIPCRIAFQMIESATGVAARKSVNAAAAMAMISATVDSTEGVMSTVVAALMDLMHSYEHVAPICAEICCMVSENPTNRLALELLREIGRLNTNGLGGGETGGKASGIKNVAPFISHLASLRPRTVLANIPHLMPHFNSECYNLRSALVAAIANILSSSDGLKEKTGSGGEGDESHAMPSDSKSRGALLQILKERVHDVSSFSRSAVLKAWIQIVQSQSLPVEWFIPVTELAIDRLRDKTIMVRRQSMQLLTTVLENNPFMGDLTPKRYQVKLEELTNFLKENLPEDLKAAHNAALQDTEEEENIKELAEATVAAAIAEAESFKDEDGLTEQQEMFRSKVKALKFTRAVLDFVDLFEKSSESFQAMLLSTNTSDVTEALRFFVQARLFKLPCAISGMKNALTTLMWSSDQAICEEVRKAFVEVFLAEPGTEGKIHLPHEQIAENLLALVSEASISEIASIEEAVVSLVRDENIPADVFLILWGVASRGSQEATRASSAMQLISMAAGAGDKGRVIVDGKSRLKLLLDSCLGDYTEERKDWKLARAAACALQKVERAVVDEGEAKWLVLERIMDRLAAVCRGDWCNDDNLQDTLEWFSASEEAIKALFVLSPFPEMSCREIVSGMYMLTFNNGRDSECNSLRLARFFHVLGGIVLNLLCYTEALSSGVRQANAKKNLQKQIEADAKKAQKKKSSKDSDSEDELEANEAAALEAETERQMAEITETEILGTGMVAAFVPLLVKVVGNEGGRFHSEILQQASMLALCKFMCVSASFCEKHLPLVFSALSKAPKEDTTMRANTVVALGDLAFRYPNEVEPYTPHLYACLRDSSTKVRRHTLMVLTHLILNDMVKVKGQVCEIALCLQDEDCRIKDMAGLLFHSLANRSNNPIYNLLPDVVSQLGQRQISQDSFRSIMMFLLGFIKKEKQSTMLTEKLVQRMGKATQLSQKADLVFCVGCLKHSDKSIKILMDSFKLYQDALHDEDVKKNLLSIISKSKKGAKNEQRDRLEEFEQKVLECADQGKENEATDAKAARANRKKRNIRKKKVQVDSDEEVGKLSQREINKENRRSTRRRQAAKM